MYARNKRDWKAAHLWSRRSYAQKTNDESNKESGAKHKCGCHQAKIALVLPRPNTKGFSMCGNHKCWINCKGSSEKAKNAKLLKQDAMHAGQFCEIARSVQWPFFSWCWSRIQMWTSPSKWSWSERVGRFHFMGWIPSFRSQMQLEALVLAIFFFDSTFEFSKNSRGMMCAISLEARKTLQWAALCRTRACNSNLGR